MATAAKEMLKLNSKLDSVLDKLVEVEALDSLKDEIKSLMRPVIDMLLHEITPYIYLSITFVFISFYPFCNTVSLPRQ